MTTVWRPTPFLRRVLLLAAFGLVVSLLSGRPAFAVAAVAPLCLALVPSVKTAQCMKVDIVVDRERCFETEAVRVRAVLTADLAVTSTERLRTPDGIATTREPPVVFTDVSSATSEWELRADRWGRRMLGPVVATVYSEGFLLTSTVHSRAVPLSIFPAAESLRQLPLPRVLPSSTGDHVSRGIGDGVEFAGARPMVAGDSARRMNWRATARYGRPFVTQFYTERSSDVVLIVDGLSEVGELGRTTIDISVRGAAALARSYLTSHDRVGVIALGGVLHWVTRQGGVRQLYRVLETLMDVRDFVSVVRPALDRLPRVALPPGALVVMFTPLLDPRSIEVARHLRERGLPLVVIDVLTVEPAVAPKFATSELALRLWRLERRAIVGRLIELGAHVVRWDGQSPLDIPLGALRSLGRLA
jgi:uncharacterized protein (DUF58 family)